MSFSKHPLSPLQTIEESMHEECDEYQYRPTIPFTAFPYTRLTSSELGYAWDIAAKLINWSVVAEERNGRRQSYDYSEAFNSIMSAYINNKAIEEQLEEDRAYHKDYTAFLGKFDEEGDLDSLLSTKSDDWSESDVSEYIPDEVPELDRDDAHIE